MLQYCRISSILLLILFSGNSASVKGKSAIARGYQSEEKEEMDYIPVCNPKLWDVDEKELLQCM